MVTPNPFVVTGVKVVGVRETIVALSAETTAYADRVTAALVAEAKVVRDRARHNMGQFRYKGRAQAATTWWFGTRSPNFIMVKVGIRGNTFAPEGKTFEVGWRSKRGLQPPVGTKDSPSYLTQWVIARHIGPPNRAVQTAYAIARAQGARGYSFGERHWLSDAYAGADRELEALAERYASAFWASQARVPAGSSTGGRFLG